MDNWASDRGGAIAGALPFDAGFCLWDGELVNRAAADTSVWTVEEMNRIAESRFKGRWDWGVSLRETNESSRLIADQGVVALDDCRFYGNYAGNEGGAVAWGQDQLSAAKETSIDQVFMPVIGVRNCEFRDNRAGKGGALAVRRLAGAMLLQHVVASGNRAAVLGVLEEGGKPVAGSPGVGGVVHVGEPLHARSVLILRGVTAWENHATWGGVVHGESGSNVLMSGVLTWNNDASTGGVLHCEECGIVGSQLDSVRAADCLTEGLPSISAAAIQPSVTGNA